MRTVMRSVTIHGWHGTGRTVAEAKADAIRRIEQAAKMPARVSWFATGDHLWAIYTDHEAGTWATSQTDLTAVRDGKTWGCVTSGYPTENEAWSAVLRHRARLGTNLDADFWATLERAARDLFPGLDYWRGPLPDDAEADVADYLRWLGWQYRYRAAREAGLNDTDARAAIWRTDP